MGLKTNQSIFLFPLQILYHVVSVYFSSKPSCFLYHSNYGVPNDDVTQVVPGTLVLGLGLGLGKSCSFGLPRVPFVNCCQYMYLVVSLLVLRAGGGI